MVDFGQWFQLVFEWLCNERASWWRANPKKTSWENSKRFYSRFQKKNSVKLKEQNYFNNIVALGLYD